MQTFAEVQAASSAAYRTLGDLEWEVELEREPRTFIHVKRAKRFDPVG